MTQNQVVAQVVAAIEAVGIRYMVAGSFASNYHGVPRMTQDADIVIEASREKLGALLERLRDEFYASDTAAEEALKRRSLFNVIHTHTGLKVDLIVKKRRPFSNAELDRRKPGDLAGMTIFFASAEDTILTKLEWARDGQSARQYEDALGVARVQGAFLDWDYIAHWGTKLDVAHLIEHLRSGLPFPVGTG